MTATNHVVTGIFVASVIHNPIIALPVALASHFVCDALPHYGDMLMGHNSFKFKLILGTDMYLAAMILFLVYLLHPDNMWVLIFGGIFAASPDLMWIPDFVASLTHKPAPVYGPIRRFHSRIQWYQKPKGIWVEAVWFLIFFIISFGYTIPS